jgi:2-iminobutanoate/2-iminopropanoate deaminase
LQLIETAKVSKTGSPLSQGVLAGGFLFVSGQTPRLASGLTVDGDFEAEVRCVLDNVSAIIEAAGGSLRQVCKVNAYLTDASLFDQFNAVYRDYFKDAQYPARTTICCALARPGLRVEVEATAWLG